MSKSTGIVLIGFSAAAIILWSTRYRTKSGDAIQAKPNGCDDSSATDDLNKLAEKFPWEPHLASTVSSTTKARSSLSSKEQQQQLDFLASMKFSNGGLRPPSCPCCQ